MFDSPQKKVAGGIVGAVMTLAAIFGITSGDKTDYITEPANRTSGSWSAASAYETSRTETIRFRHTRADGTYGSPKTQENAMLTTYKVLAKYKGKGYRMKRLGNDFGKVITLNAVKKRLPSRLFNLPTNGVWVIQAVSTGYTIRLKKVDINPAKVINTNANDAIDIVVGTLVSQGFPVINYGTVVCKRISGSGSWSQHAYGNAVDFGGSVEMLDRAANFLLLQTRKGNVPVSQILWNHKNLLTGRYVYDHTNHIHVSGAPLRSGYPPYC